jgi:hypothetical protein
MYKTFLTELFRTLDSEKVNYLILRGYQDLPEIVHYDLDFAVVNESELTPFFKILYKLSKKYKYRISRDVVRQGLLKVFLHFGNEILKVDVFCSFGYAGLEYINSDDLHRSKRKLITGIWVPDLNYELALSLLKEILHNSRIREDKVNLLRKQFNQKTFKEPFTNYFSERNINYLSDSLFLGKKLVFKRLSFYFRFELLLSNFKHHGVLKTIVNIFNFFWIKYNQQSKYDKYIFIG